jgi:Tannase-like family of unknown function (DUF6351)
MSIKEKDMKRLSLGTDKIEGPERAAKKISYSIGSLAIATVVLAIGVTTYSTGSAQGKPDNLPAKYGIRTLSTHADRVSGGDVLVEVRVPNAKLPWLVTLNGRNVSEAFHPGEKPNSLIGLVTGLVLGKNRLVIRGGGLGRDSLIVTNYPIKGPIVSGPHLQPHICQTQDFTLPDGNKLGPPTDADCSAPTQVHYIYRSTAGGAFQPLSNTSSLPADVAMTTTLTGVTVPYVVRVETGTMNRGIYQNAILHDPTSEPAPTPFLPPKGWNKRLIAMHGAGCPGGWYIQGAAQGANILDVTRLGEGYALFINTLNHPTNSCNPFLAGETTMMGKEHFIETFGVPHFTVSTGGSGGAYTSLQVGDAFPGLFDGVLISATFPDALSIALTGLDGHLLTHYFAVTDPAGFTDAQKVAVTGYKGIQAWIDAANQSQRTDPVPGRVDIPGYNSAVWNAAVPEALRYHPVNNPGGARPTIFDLARNIYGVDPTTGFALRPFDNVGVQYGLAALNGKAITTTQFLDLNEKIGGYDQDANYLSSRSVGDAGAIKRVQQSGVSLGGGGLASIPVFDITLLYDEDFIYHYQHFHFAVRERMMQANGHADNHVMWRGGATFAELQSPTPESAALNTVVAEESWEAFIKWVEAVKSDHSKVPDRIKVVRNRPAELVDGCWTKQVNPQFVPEPQTFSSQPDSQCNTLWPSFSFPRKVAGGPLAANKLKCQLKPIDVADYDVTFTGAELTRLHSIFSDGVCDWSKPGINQTGVVPWASFGPSPDNLIFDVSRPERMSKVLD